MKLMMVLLALAMCGCTTTRMTADGRKVVNESLRAMAHNTRTPQVGKVYFHNGGQGMEVIQALDGGVLVHPVVGHSELRWRGEAAINEKLTIYVETPEIYVDGEYLREGLYEFTGRYSYTAVNDVPKTVRKFREVRPAPEN